MPSVVKVDNLTTIFLRYKPFAIVVNGAHFAMTFFATAALVSAHLFQVSKLVPVFKQPVNKIQI